MPFVVDVRRINSWKSRQKPRLEVYELPIIPESTRGKTPGQRALNYFLAALMLGGPLLVFFIFLVPFAPQLGRGAQIFAYLVFAAFTIAMVKNFFSFIGQAVGSASRSEVLWQAGKKFAKNSDVMAAIRCFGESLSLPWKKRSDPSTSDAYDVLVTTPPNNTPNDLLLATKDLLFVEMWLEITLNSSDAYAGLSDDGAKIYRNKMVELASDYSKVNEFAGLIVGMAKGQEAQDEGLHKVVEDLARILRKNAPKAAEVLARAFPTKAPPFHNYRAIKDIVKFILEGDDLNAQDANGLTLLHLAAGEGNAELVDTLLAYGANYQILDKNSRKAIDIAQEANHSNIVASLENVNNLHTSFSHPQPNLDTVIQSQKELKDLAASYQGLLFTDCAEKGAGEEYCVGRFTQIVLPPVQLRLSHCFQSPAFRWANAGSLFRRKGDLEKFLDDQEMGSPGVIYFRDGAIIGYKKYDRGDNGTTAEDEIRAATDLLLGEGSKKKISI